LDPAHVPECPAREFLKRSMIEVHKMLLPG